ncbi:hypothetical protein CLV51_105145 [Chitinophaga niastensis]|uniref:Uncharacterized protein n=1 Tax=Chitinophaga niastensis TaxID=536980 RepID=A0A2P8HEY4_CHINA|nr:hypothetical protein CLV51_105145 [Chitinophaga niastensis]
MINHLNPAKEKTKAEGLPSATTAFCWEIVSTFPNLHHGFFKSIKHQ